MKTKFTKAKIRNGFVLVMAMIFVAIFGALAVAMVSMSTNNTKIAENQHKAANALAAAHSGLEFGKYLAATCDTSMSSFLMDLTASQVNNAWTALANHIATNSLTGSISATTFTDANGSGEEISTEQIPFGANSTNFNLRYYHYDDDPNVYLQVVGGDGTITRLVSIAMEIARNNSVLKYAIASRGRIWLTSETTVNGDIFSTWDATNYGSAGIETTDEVVNNGTLSTINSIAELDSVSVQMETLDANNNPVFDSNGNRVYSSGDTVQGYHEGIIYDESEEDLPGMSEDDYDTSSYESLCSANVIAASDTNVVEYFPHLAGDYNYPRDGEPGSTWNETLDRHVYDGVTFTDAFLPKGRNALFVNCTFEGVLFVESQSWTSSNSLTNNVRFEDCAFNGVVVTDIPQNSSIRWRENCLYFTGGAIFENQWSQQEATILAPNFNVNLGNATELEYGQSSVLTGAIVGGIVDIRGIVEIDGTIISMYDTIAHSGGYVTNIGSTDDDGGTEGGAFEGEDINISPSQQQLLPDGVQADIIIIPLQQTYEEG